MIGRADALRRGLVPAVAVAVALGCAALLVFATGVGPDAAAAAVWHGAFGSPRRIAFALDRAGAYALVGTGVALCFRAGVINIGGEGQIALGGLCCAAVALAFPALPPIVAVPLAVAFGMLGGAGWALLAAALHVLRHVNEVVVTLLLNFVAALLVEVLLHGRLGEVGAGVLQTPLLPPAYVWPALFGADGPHAGVPLALVAALLGQLLLYRTSPGFALRVMGDSRLAAAYAGLSPRILSAAIMALAGSLAGLAGACEVMGMQQRLIDGFSRGFGFNAIAVALLAALEPWAVVPAAVFFAFLETGTVAMQRRVGVPSSLVVVIQGMTMLVVLATLARRPANRAGDAALAVAT